MEQSSGVSQPDRRRVKNTILVKSGSNAKQREGNENEINEVSMCRVLCCIHLPMGERRMTRSGASSGENDAEVRGKLGVTIGPQILKLKSVASMTR